MRRGVLLLTLVLSVAGCKGKQGDKGSDGAPGTRGPAGIPPIGPMVQQFTGTVGTGTALIGTSLKSNSVVLVYLEAIGTPGQYVLLSIDLSATSPWCEISYPAGAVLFHNANATSNYKILVLNPS